MMLTTHGIKSPASVAKPTEHVAGLLGPTMRRGVSQGHGRTGPASHSLTPTLSLKRGVKTSGCSCARAVAPALAAFITLRRCGRQTRVCLRPFPRFLFFWTAVAVTFPPRHHVRHGSMSDRPSPGRSAGAAYQMTTQITDVLITLSSVSCE
jgi:hypothetical protein